MESASNNHAQTRFIKVVHQESKHTVGLYAGLCPLELSKLLTAVFGLSAKDGYAPSAVVGFSDDSTGVVLPISLACSRPHLLSQPTYRLLLTDTESFLASPSPPTPSSASVPTLQLSSSIRQSSSSVQPPPAPPAAAAAAAAKTVVGFSQQQQQQDGEEEEVTEGQDDNESSGDEEEEEEDEDDLKPRMLRFLSQLVEERLLSQAEDQILRKMILEDSRVLAAGYRVAQYRKNAELLAAFWKTTAAASLSQAEMKLVLLAQEQMLEILGLLASTERLTATQHINLEYLVLLQHESVSDVYEQFRQNGDLQDFCLTLAAVANAAERLITDPNLEKATATVLKEGNNEAGEAEQGGGGKKEEEGVKSMEEVIAGLQENAGLRTELASWLLREYKAGDEYMMAAYDIYLADKNEAELVDSLLRIIKVKIEALKSIHEEQKKKAQQQQQQQQQQSAAATTAPSTRNEKKGKDGAAAAAEEGGGSAAGGGGSGVPKEFMAVIVNAVRHKVLSTEQGACLCDLFAKGNEFVRAAWEVFVLERDVGDFIDTLMRVLIKEGRQHRASLLQKKTEEEAAETTAAATTTSFADPSITRKTILAQCLEVMVAKNLINLQGFRALVGLLNSGSEILQAALDAFIVDRDVGELIDTLQLIAAHGIDQQDSSLGNQTTTVSAAATTTSADCGREEVRSSSSDKPVKCSTTASVGCTEDDRSVTYTSVGSNTSHTSAGAAAGSGELSLADQEELLITLAAAGAITEDEWRTLIGLAHKRDWVLRGHFKDFAATKDVHEFQRHLKLLAAEAARKMAMNVEGAIAGVAVAVAGGGEIEEGEENEEEEDDDVESNIEEEEEEDEEEDEEETDELAEIDELFFDIVQEMNPSGLETAALRLCIARNDVRLQSALEFYRSNGNADFFKETLKQIARRTIVDISRDMPMRADEEERDGRERVADKLAVEQQQKIESLMTEEGEGKEGKGMVVEKSLRERNVAEGGPAATAAVASSSASQGGSTKNHQWTKEAWMNGKSSPLNGTKCGGGSGETEGDEAEGLLDGLMQQKAPKQTASSSSASSAAASFLAAALEKKLVLTEEERRVLGLMNSAGDVPLSLPSAAEANLV